MKLPRTSSVTYLLVAVVISLIVNFSYLLLLVVNPVEFEGPIDDEKSTRPIVMGMFVGSVDGFGYVVTDSGDSVYVSRRGVRMMDLTSGDIVEVETVQQEHYPNSHPTINRLLVRNGEPFDRATMYKRPNQVSETIYQILYYLLVAFVMLIVMNISRSKRNFTIGNFTKRAAVCIIIGVAAYFLAPTTNFRTGETLLVYQSRHLIDFVVMLKCLFVLAVTLLYSQIYVLTYQRQQMVLENERLAGINLSTRYNMLVSQISPHFFFNSLNSLSMLVREKDEKRALEYIDQLSYTFRYITQNGNNSELVTLDEELEFADAYCYLFRIRYADKIFFDIDIDPQYRSWRLPALSLQPLIGNAVKHNAITSKNPFHVRIYTDDGCLVVANQRRPLLTPQTGTGTGLKNLCNRYELMIGRKVDICSNDEEFVVRLPLIKV